MYLHSSMVWVYWVCHRKFWLFILLLSQVTFIIGQSTNKFSNTEQYLIEGLGQHRIGVSDSVLIDSCLNIFHNTKNDSLRADAINGIVEISGDENIWPKYNQWLYDFALKQLEKGPKNRYYQFFLNTRAGTVNNFGFLAQSQGDFENATKYFNESYQVYLELKDSTGVANCLNNLGYVMEVTGDVSKGLEYYLESLRLREIKNDTFGIANSLNNIGYIFKNEGDGSKALQYFLKSLHLREQLGDRQSISILHNNIGLCYQDQEDYENALNYFQKSLKVEEATENFLGLAIVQTNIGNVQLLQNNYKEALSFYQKSYDLFEEIENERGLAAGHNRLSEAYLKMNESDSAQVHGLKSIELYEKIEDKEGLASAHNSIANVYLMKNQLQVARKHGVTSLELAQSLKFKSNIAEAAFTLSKINQQLGIYKSSLELYQLGVLTKDSLRNKEVEKSLLQQQSDYEHAKQQALEEANHKAQIALHQQEVDKQKLLKKIFIGGLIALAFFIGYVLYRYKKTSERKKIIEQQKLLVDEANEELNQQNEEILAITEQIERQNKELTVFNNEIVDSINYAKKIQETILPSSQYISTAFEEHMILYRPKDIISGDFYWMTKVGNKVIWSVVDCTGHGVPGAFMSLLGYNGLQKIVAEQKITTPSEILYKLTTFIETALSKTGQATLKDGMDMAICCLDTKTGKLEYSGAHNPLWIYSNGELQVTKGAWRPIGHYDVPRIPDFINHEVEINKGDRIFMFSDGFSDQFGGPENFKVGAKRFKQLIKETSELPISEQDLAINKFIDDWKGNTEQLDDICVWGVQI